MDLKHRLIAGETINGIMLSELYTPNIIRILANCGYDYVLIDCEHGYFDLSQVANLVAVANGIQLPIWVRVTKNSQADVVKYLDMGARGILLANTECPAQVSDLIRMCLYAPLGDRSISTFRAHTNYRNDDMRTMMEEANDQNVIIAQIESPGAVEQIDSIMALDRLDGVLIGPNDLSLHMGMIGNYHNDQLKNMLRKVAVSAETHNKWSGIITANEWLLRFCHHLGMCCFSSSSELNALADGAQANLHKLLRTQQ
jgi:2-keto-3-deoxy-L-rhamnonate aldolase RhmA